MAAKGDEDGRGDGLKLAPSQAVVLGALQGPAELLPVSSSGHLVLVPELLGWSYRELDPDSDWGRKARQGLQLISMMTSQPGVPIDRKTAEQLHAGR